MIKSGIDQEALIRMFSEATAKQGEAVGHAVREATLRALQGRELTLDNIGKVLKVVTQAASAGAARNQAEPVDIEALLARAFKGMDAALLQTVEAHHKALERLVAQGAHLENRQMKGALANLELIEDTFFAAVTKATQHSGNTLRTPWLHLLQAMKLEGTETGEEANAALEQLLEQARKAVRDGRVNGVRAVQAMINSYAALVSGVLIGMSEGLQPGAAHEPHPPRD
ncbi:DUF6781 family protein [Paraburkholderia sp.]|uniref:DUF6781 family protein n=1 Tax=Paraburkholderia sp. TaxID=1926495 RepID=UPI0039E2E20A